MHKSSDTAPNRSAAADRASAIPNVAPTCAVIVPALDEEACIGGVVQGLLKLRNLPQFIQLRVLVVDNGSRDATARVAAEAGAEVVTEPRRGYGYACLAGAVAAGPETEVLLFGDGDGSDSPLDLVRVVAPLLHQEADLVLGSRVRGHHEPGALTPQQIAGNRVATALLHLLYDVRLTDIGPSRAIRRQALLDLGMREMIYGWPVEMVARAARRGYRITEVPVDCKRRAGGRSKVGGTLRGSLRAGWHMLTTIVRGVRRSKRS